MDNKIPFNLVQIRKMRRLTQSGLAEKSGISIQTISGLENGENTSHWPNGDTLARLAQALECSIDEIVFGFKGPVPPSLGKSDAERILISIAELVCLDSIYIHGEKGISRGWGEEAFIDLDQSLPKELIFDFIDSIRELNSVRKKHPKSKEEIDKMIKSTILDYASQIDGNTGDN